MISLSEDILFVVDLGYLEPFLGIVLLTRRCETSGTSGLKRSVPVTSERDSCGGRAFLGQRQRKRKKKARNEKLILTWLWLSKHYIQQNMSCNFIGYRRYQLQWQRSHQQSSGHAAHQAQNANVNLEVLGDFAGVVCFFPRLDLVVPGGRF